MKRATDLAGIQLSCDPRPLTIAELPDFFVETAQARDPQSNRRFELAAELSDASEHTKVLLAGHGGSGKSTELTKFCADHAAEFFAVPFSISREATLASITIESLLVLVVERTLSAAKDAGLEPHLSTTTLDGVHRWFDEALEQRQTSRDTMGEVGGQVGAAESLLGKLLGVTAGLKADIRAGSRVLRQTITRENHRLAQLAERCAEVLKEVTLALASTQPGRQLLVVVEDLDKASIADAERLFFDEPGPLADLPCKAIYTLPIFLTCSPRIQALDARYRLHTLPMIKVVGLDGHRDDAGFGTMRQLVGQRLDLDLVDPEALDEAIFKTGGVLRDIFAVLTSASSVARQALARDADRARRITLADVRYGLNRRKSALLRGISVAGLPKEYGQVSVDQLYERLRLYGDQPIRNAKSDPINLALMQAHALLEYNGERWYRVHPLVFEQVGTRDQP